MLTVYGRTNSSNSAKVFWLLQELGQDYRLVPTGRGFAATNTPEFLALNPFGKVPVVQDGEMVVWESNAVLRHLASRFPTPLWPAEPGLRSRVDGWMDWASLSLTPPLTRLRKARAAGKTEDTDLPAVIAAFAALDRWLAGHSFIAGDRLSLADITAAPAVYRFFLLQEAGTGFANLARYAGLLAEYGGYRHFVRDALS
ncbi:glutathione S-transferase family protein [Gemmobacter serpentinus]|uniref:glutathione S-transferase family protein n=1 Tax=Gemmobacter serpentinus TaxID=2652247 RepID=UPI00124F4363|nr:glutathione S-transferase family protein [Gemmobacter serpentinus]